LRCLAVLGQRDEPTDAVEEYCRYLGEALNMENIALGRFRVRWAEIGWPASLRELHAQARDPKNNWFLLQYTALAWSSRAFPFRVLRLVQSLKKQGACCAIVFHDAEAYGGRWVGAVRRNAQLFVMRRLLRASDLAIFTLPRDRISWISADAKNVVFIPVGANLPAPERAWTQERIAADGRSVVAVFSITGKAPESREVHAIAEAVIHAAKEAGPLRLVILGRNSEHGGEQLKVKLHASPVEVSVLGLIPAEEVVRVLASSDVLLFVRGPISSSRGSAIAGIACGLPVIAREGRQTAPPITGAGVVLVPPDTVDFGPALVRVLTDHSYRASLAERSRNAQQSYFAWSVIAAQYAQALRKNSAAR
jgi:glycosyltransferase involved in cell wall biosynthesis